MSTLTKIQFTNCCCPCEVLEDGMVIWHHEDSCRFGEHSEFERFQRIRLKHIKAMLSQLNERTDAKAVLMAEEKAIEEFLHSTS